MSESGAGQFIGNQQVAVFIGSRYRNGGIIPDGDQERILIEVQDRLSRKFGGSTAPRANDVRGAYLHGDESGQVVAEHLVRAYAVVTDDVLKEPETRAFIESLAGHVAVELDQESVLYALGPECGYVWGSKDGPRRHVPFGEFDEATQRRCVRAACDQLRRAADFRAVLSLDGWRPVPVPEEDPEHRLASKGERRAILVDITEPLPLLRDGDLAFGDDSDRHHVRIWANVGGTMRGPQRVLVTGRQVARITADVCLALLGSKAVSPLDQILDRDFATSRFYRGYARLHDRLAIALGKAYGDPDSGARRAQRLLGRLMLLRFLEQRGWLDNNRRFLADRFAHRPDEPFTRELDRLFGLLDTPGADRTDPTTNGVPFLNGGLFHVTEPTPEIGDDFFDPAVPGSVLALFQAHDFTLDEGTAADQVVGVDPAMFGRVLESLCDPERKKNEGVVYTPTPIGQALAFESIASRLASLSRLPRTKVVAFLRGDPRAVDERGAQKLLRCAKGLRIVDPAVGSGSLLLAALEVLMQVASACEWKKGSTLRRGAGTWGTYTRHFVQHCLFGVDIDPEAVEVARLRLWLAIAVADESPRALPDLTWNLCAGDSLGSRKFDRAILEKGLWRRQGSLFDRGSKDLDAYWAALDAYQKAASRGGPAVAEATSRLEEAERSLLRRLGKQGATRPRSSSPGAPPFAWTVHFGDVFAGPNQGFDVVVANPPYVRAANIEGEFEEYASMKGNRDLYLAFVERALDLAGKGGEIAYVLPNFGETTWGGGLRRLLAARGAVERMVSFGGQRVFKHSLAFVALLFATSKLRKETIFKGGRVPDESWREAKDSRWLDGIAATSLDAGSPIWQLRTAEEERTIVDLSKGSVRLGELCEIGIGIQTSADDVFLFENVVSKGRRSWKVYSEHVAGEVDIEPEALRRCAKGSKDLQATELLNDRWMLWPYDKDGQPMGEAALRERLPLAWNYLERCRKRLQARKMKGDQKVWWRFGRFSEMAVRREPKVLVPALMKGAAAYLDGTGDVTMTASGKGGGGAWGIVPRRGPDGRPLVELAGLARALSSPAAWTWIASEANPKASGWRGVGREELRRMPVRVS